MTKKVIYTKDAPEPIGPYNQAILSGNTLYASGQIAIDPKTSELVTGDIRKETSQVMRNIEAVLKAANMNFSHIIKSTIFIMDMNDFPAINEVYGSFFQQGEEHFSDQEPVFPARETVQVAALPKGVNVEISVIAVKG